MKEYLKPGTTFYVGDLIGKLWKVHDGSVTCKNIATAALYRYTPWIGDRDHSGNKAPFGNFLFYRVWTGLFGPINLTQEQEPDASQPETTPENWRIIAPPDNWRNPIAISEKDTEKFEQLANLLQLRYTKDETGKKLYLGLPSSYPVVSETEANLAKFPSGEKFPIVDGSPWVKQYSTYWAPHPEVAAHLIRITRENHARNLSPNFKLNEFTRRDTRYDLVRISPKLIEVLEKIREKIGGLPIHVTSAYRPYPYNASLSGAAQQSYHIDGVAADIYVKSMSVSKLYAVADSIVGNTGGVGAYYESRFVHVDVRGYHSRW